MFKRKKVEKETTPELGLLDLKIIEMFLNDARESLSKKILKSSFPLAEFHSLCLINTTAAKIEKLLQISEGKDEYM